MLFEPKLASITRMEFCGALGSFFARTLRIFASSPIKFSFVWSLPAVSSTSHLAPSDFAACQQSHAVAAASAPCALSTSLTPSLSAHTRICSFAAALKVSHAPSTTPPSASRIFASFAAVVVFPAPLTPTRQTTDGFESALFASEPSEPSSMRASTSAPISAARRPWSWLSRLYSDLMASIISQTVS